MSEVKDRYKNLFYELSDRLNSGFTIGLNARRREWIEDFVESDSSPQEALLDGAWRIVSSGECLPQENLGTNVINVCNGRVVGRDFAETDKGVIFCSLRDAAIDFESLIADSFNSIAENKSNSMTALNSSFVEDGVFAYIPKGIKERFTINFHYTSTHDALAFSRLLVVAEDGADVDISVNYTSNGKMLIDHVGEIVARHASSVNIVELFQLGSETSAAISTYHRQDSDSFVKVVGVDLGGENINRANVVDLAQSHSLAQIYSLSITMAAEISVTETTMRHLVPDCQSEQKIKAIASGCSKNHFEGRIYVQQDAQQTSAMQQYRGLQIGDESRLGVKPQLEIYADDVKCSHGASIGQMDQEALFYMRQRGLSEKSAKALQMSGFVGDIMMKIDDKALAQHIFEICQTRIDEL